MKTYRTLTTIGGAILAASLALAQVAPTAPPAPAAPPVPHAAPAAQAPAAPIAPVAPTPWPTPAIAPIALMPPVPVDLDLQLADARAQLGSLNLDVDLQTTLSDRVQEQMDRAREQMETAQDKMVMASASAAARFHSDALSKSLALQPSRTFTFNGKGGDEAMYQNGLRAIDEHQYDQALSEFNNVAVHAGARAEGALYWKAYVLNKLGRAADAQAAIDTLRKTYPNSRWLDDAKVLELEVKQTKGPVSPEAESDEQLKIYALNGLMQNDPEKALPQVEKILKGSHSPSLKRQALTVIAGNNTPQAQQVLERIARGGNPDLQVRAIQYMSVQRNPNTPQILLEIYTSASDPAVKRAVLASFSSTRDKGRLLQVLRTEKDGSLRSSAIRELGSVEGQPELWQIYQSETGSEGKIAVLDVMRQNGNLDKLTEVARTDKDPKVRQKAIEVIATQESGTPMAALVQLYSSEQDEKVKQTVVDYLGSRRGNCQSLVDVAKAEKDIKLKLRIVERLSGMTKSCPAATDYLTELLSK